jgi:hypothetical protein
MATRLDLIEIEPEPEDVITDELGSIAYLEDGTIEVRDADYDDVDGPQEGPRDHRANLARFLTESERTRIAEELIEAFERDKEARRPWEQRLAKGLETVGYVPRPDADLPFEGACSAVYPLISEATIQFNARALDELFPAAGPVKTIVIGDKTPEKEEQAERVQDYMNFQVTEEDRGWQDEDDRLLMLLPLDGHGWKKVYRDERLGIQTSKFVKGQDVFAPYAATATHSIPRLCHRWYASRNDVRFEQLSGNWLKIDLQPPPGDDERERGEVQDAIDQAEGSEAASSEPDDEGTHQILEFYVDYDLPQFEHVDDETNEPTGFALPYVITVELDSRQVLKIVRNWAEGDELFRKRINLIPYRFLPGLGFYGHGFLHAIGGLNEAATGALRALLDSAHRANMQGGFVTNDARMKGGSIRITSGEWTPVDASMEEMQKAFYTPPWQPPSEALFKLLGMLVEAGKSFTSTTEAMTGAAPSTGPVGTMVALIEQGSKVFSGIHKRLHKSKRDEYRLLAELNAEHIPQEGYPYDVGEASRQIYAQDFGPAVDVLPVSDPNIFSAQQRIAIAQALLELAQRNPDLYDIHEAHRRMLEALKVPAIDDVLLDRDRRPRHDPVSENMLALNGQAIHAHPDQMHEAHIKVHQDFMMHPGFGGNPEVAQVIGPAMTAHLAQHLAYLYQQRMLASAQLPYIPVDVGAPRHDDAAPEVPPQVQEEIAVRAAMASGQFMQTQGLPQPPPQPSPEEIQAQLEQAKTKAELERKQAAFELDSRQKAQASGAEQQRKQAEWQAEEERKQAEWQAEQRREEEQHAAEMRRQAERAAQERYQREASAEQELEHQEERAEQELEQREERAEADLQAQKRKAKADEARARAQAQKSGGGKSGKSGQ